MKDGWTNTDALLRAVEIDADSLVALLFELARRDDGISEQARETAESLMGLLDTVAGVDANHEEGE